MGMEPLREQLAALPDAPGVYLFRDGDDRVMYVGKAKSLRTRVFSYFAAPVRGIGDEGSSRPGPTAGLHPRITEMVSRVRRMEALVVNSEQEALILESNLITTHRPPFNVKLRDGKSYPYIGISVDEAYPRVYFTRERHHRDRVYFGPFASASKVRETLSLIGKIFPSRPCEGTEPGRPSGIPCLDYHIKRCLAPCVDYISRDDYRALIDQIIAFLSGRYRGLEVDLEDQMRTASVERRFEDAALYRNRLNAVRHLMEHQLMASDSMESFDVIGVAVDDDGEAANVQVLQVRDGVLGDRQSFFVDSAGARDEATIFEQFVMEYYALGLAIPPLVIVPPGTATTWVETLFAERRQAGVEVRASARGEKRRLQEMAVRNARLALDQDRARVARTRERRTRALADLQECLGLDAPPVRIECFDISNLGATYAVASMAVLLGGASVRSHYRSFTMSYGGGPDDVVRMAEAIGRRMARLAANDDDVSLGARPSLVVVDGGKGQLGAAQRAMRAAGVEVPMVGLAKRMEEVFVPGRSDPLLLPEDSPGLRLLQQVRDEAHRFALRHHRGRRGRGMTASTMDALPGIGPARRRAILRHFGSPERFMAATRAEMEAVHGLPSKVARDLFDHLNTTGGPDQVETLTGSGDGWN
ncbi:MAG: excinuclease ABC subunit UvrC [Thermoleophilia bacterium]|nr:excinuclease ABC subunit UvrC [Thermoleophilia bacterium]